MIDSNLLELFFVCKSSLLSNLTPFGTENEYSMINTRDIFYFLHLINSSSIMLILLVIISAIMSSNTTEIFLFLCRL